MKNLGKIVFVVLCACLGSANLFSQQTPVSATASANVSATISRPLFYNKTYDTEEGSMFMVVGALLEITTSTKSASGKGSIMLPISTASFTAAIFNLKESSGLTYNITVPDTPLTFRSGAKTMKVTSMTLDPYLSGENGMTAGIYVSVTPFDVTVNYN